MVFLIREVFEFEWFFEITVEKAVHASACNLELSIHFMSELHWFCILISPFTFMVASICHSHSINATSCIQH